MDETFLNDSTDHMKSRWVPPWLVDGIDGPRKQLHEFVSRVRPSWHRRCDTVLLSTLGPKEVPNEGYTVRNSSPRDSTSVQPYGWTLSRTWRFYLLGILHLHPNLGTTESQWCTQSRFRDGDGRFHSYSRSRQHQAATDSSSQRYLGDVETSGPR